MRIVLFLLCAYPALASGQVREEVRFGVRYNEDLYPQLTPRQALNSVLRALEKERYDYFVAFLLDRGLVEEQLRASFPNFEKKAQEQVDRETLRKKGLDPQFIRLRVKELATQASFDNLVRRVRAKLEDDPEALKELRLLAREGQFVDGLEASSVKHDLIKGRALFLRLTNGRWHLENKMQE